MVAKVKKNKKEEEEERKLISPSGLKTNFCDSVHGFFRFMPPKLVCGKKIATIIFINSSTFLPDPLQTSDPYFSFQWLLVHFCFVHLSAQFPHIAHKAEITYHYLSNFVSHNPLQSLPFCCKWKNFHSLSIIPSYLYTTSSF